MGSLEHDLNNHLAVILNYAHAAREALPVDHPARAELAEIDRAAQRAAALVRGGAAGAPEPAPATGAITILVVDDDDALRRVIERLLARAGHHVLVAPGPAEALALCRDHQGAIDVLLTDVAMPAASGHDLAAQVAALQPGISVIYMTGGADEPGARTLAKPFEATALIAAIDAALAPDA